MSLKTVQEEIEKTLAASLRTRFLDETETSYQDFDERDVERLKKGDFEVKDLYFRLFVRARQGDLDKAYNMMVECLKWRKSYKINDITEDDLDKEVLEAGILYYHNFDKRGHPILIFQGNKYAYKTDRKKAQELEKVLAYLLEMQQKYELGKQVMVICDQQGVGLSNMDLDFFKFLINLFNIYYPHILDSFVVLEVSWRLSAVWKNIKNWLSSDMSVRFKYLNKSNLTDYVDEENLLVSMDGKDPFKYRYPPLPDNTHDPKDLQHRPYSNNDEEAPLEDATSSQDSLESQTTDEKEGSLNIEEKSGDHRVLRTRVMGGSLGTHVRNRFKGQHATVKDKPLSDPHLEEGLLAIRPYEEIVFREVGNENEVQETISLTNNSENTIIFKVKTNSPGRFRVRPSVGALIPGSSKEVTLMLLLKGDSSQEKQHYSRDKFLIMYAEITEKITNATNISDMWKTVPRSDVIEHRLNCRVLDVNGLEKRPKTIEDVMEAFLQLKHHISQIQTKLDEFSDSQSQTESSLQRQKWILFIILGFIILACVISWFR